MKKLLTLLLSVLLLSGCSVANEFKSVRPITDINNLDGRKIGVNTTWTADYVLTGRDDIILYRYDTTADMLLALMYKQLDAIALETTDWAIIKNFATGISAYKDPLTDERVYAVSYEKNKELSDDFKNFMEEFDKTERGEERSRRIKEFNDDYEYPEYLKQTGTGKTIKVAIAGESNYPMAFAKSDGTLKGFDIEAFIEFANARNYQVDFILTTWTDAFENLKKGNVDFATGFISEVYLGDFASAGVIPSAVLERMEVLVIEISDPDNLSLDADRLLETFD